jgi:microcystin-dependent protein
MATLVIPNSFEAGTPAVASEVNANFAAVRDFVELVAEGVNLDLGVIEVNRLSASAVTTLSPMGSVLPYAGVVEPASWKFCNGQTLTIADHTALYNLLTSNGTVFRYGANPTATTFLLPNLSHRVPAGLGSEVEFNALGKTGGAKNGVQSHQHTVSITGTAASGGANITVQDAGNHAHSGTTADNGNHQHATTATGFGVGINRWTPNATPSSGWIYDVTTGAAGNHNHTFDTSTNGHHGHGITDNNHGHSVSGSGTAASTGSDSGNLQQFFTLNYSIRVA